MNVLWRTPRGGDDIDQMARRMERMRGAILDALPRVGAKVVASLLSEAGMTYEALPGELAQLLRWEPSRYPCRREFTDQRRCRG